MRRKKDRSNGITALYERLSRDDDNAGESNSIVHQKQMLEDYAIKHGFTNLVHFTDDGWSGATFDRPSWNRLVEGVKNGEITACICKDTIFYRAGSDNNPVQGFVMARCKKQVDEASVQYAFMNATPVTTKADSILISDITELIHSSLKLSDFQQDLNPNYPDTRFVFGYAHDKEIYSLEVEGQKPDGVIEINVYDRTMYLWYYDDLKSDKRGNNLSYSVDMPE